MLLMGETLMTLSLSVSSIDKYGPQNDNSNNKIQNLPSTVVDLFLSENCLYSLFKGVSMYILFEKWL